MYARVPNNYLSLSLPLRLQTLLKYILMLYILPPSRYNPYSSSSIKRLKESVQHDVSEKNRGSRVFSQARLSKIGVEIAARSSRLRTTKSRLDPPLDHLLRIIVSFENRLRGAFTVAMNLPLVGASREFRFRRTSSSSCRERAGARSRKIRAEMRLSTFRLCNRITRSRDLKRARSRCC